MSQLHPEHCRPSQYIHVIPFKRLLVDLGLPFRGVAST
jgi:hypothetical protein